MPLWAVENSGSVAHTVSLDVIFPVGNSYWITKRFLPWPQNCVLRTLLPLSFETERIVVEWALCKIESVFIVTGLPCSLLITPTLISRNLTAIFPYYILLKLLQISILLFCNCAIWVYYNSFATLHSIATILLYLRYCDHSSVKLLHTLIRLILSNWYCRLRHWYCTLHVASFPLSVPI